MVTLRIGLYGLRGNSPTNTNKICPSFISISEGFFIYLRMKLRYVCDNKRHLICVPYSIENLHIMAEELGLKRCWFHKNHYDLPVKRREELEKKCQKVSSKEIVEIIRSPEYAETILSQEVKGGVAPPDYFWQTQIEYHGK